MSSIVGHMAAGIAACMACNRWTYANRRTFGVFVLLAICPDFDYFAIWLFGYAMNPRVSHSLVFALCTAALAWSVGRRNPDNPRTRLPFAALLCASLSHPTLDLLVGAHPVALLWPWPDPNVSSPGVLPSAGHLIARNSNLWRNLLIETGVLFPVLGLCVALARGVAFGTLAIRALIVAPVWFVFLAWSIGLPR